MPRWESVSRQGFYGGERCGIVRDPNYPVGLHDALHGIEVPHSWTIWPDDPPRYKVCTRCHTTRALTTDEVTAYQIAHGRMAAPTPKPKRKRTRTTKKQATEERDHDDAG